LEQLGRRAGEHDFLPEAGMSGPVWQKPTAQAVRLPGQQARVFTQSADGEQVHVVGHEHIGADLTAMRATGPIDALQVEAVLVVAEEFRRAIMATLNDVLGMPRQHEARFPSHDAIPFARGLNLGLHSN
jgi:hypothetical protein